MFPQNTNLICHDKLKNFARSEEFKKACLEAFQEIWDSDQEKSNSVIVESDEEIISYLNQGYECQPLGDGRWLMGKKVIKRDI